MRRAPKEASEFYRDMEMNVATKNTVNGRKTVMPFKTLSRQMKREINEYTLKQCDDIKSCRRKKFFRDTSELSHDKSWKIKKASHVEFVTTNILMLRHIV